MGIGDHTFDLRLREGSGEGRERQDESCQQVFPDVFPEAVSEDKDDSTENTDTSDSTENTDTSDSAENADTSDSAENTDNSADT